MNEKAQDQWRRDPGYTLPELEKNTAHTPVLMLEHEDFVLLEWQLFWLYHCNLNKLSRDHEPRALHAPETAAPSHKENVQSTEEETKDPGCLCMNGACIRCLQMCSSWQTDELSLFSAKQTS